jgi:hypothetical protein
MRSLHAHYLGTYKGRKVYRVPVLVKLNSSRLLRTLVEVVEEVVAYSAADAANFVRDEWVERPETEIFAYGPKGGVTHRFIGWESSIGAQMWNRPREEQLMLQEVMP